MRDKLTRRNLFLLATTSVLSLGLAAIPVAVDLDLTNPALKAAWADGGEGGEGGDGGDGGDGEGEGEGDGGESGDSGDSGESGSDSDSSGPQSASDDSRG